MITEKSTYVYNLYPDINYGSSANIHVCGQSSRLKRSYIEFDISNIPSVINKASLYLYCHSFAVGGSRTLNVKRTTSSWNESSMTWNSGQPTTTATNMSQTLISHTEIPTWKMWDVTNMLNDETGSTFGVQIADNDETDTITHDWYFYSDDYTTSDLRPYLLINPYYVRTTGNDSLDGTSWTNAWQTINKAATTVADGSIVHIGFGTYSNEPANNKIAPQNIGTLGIYYKMETAGASGGTGSVIIEKN